MATLMTSLEMGGVSLTLLNNADSWTDSLGNVHTKPSLDHLFEMDLFR